jgi:hypothetical protein
VVRTQIEDIGRYMLRMIFGPKREGIKNETGQYYVILNFMWIGHIVHMMKVANTCRRLI